MPSPRPPSRATTRQPGDRATPRTHRSVEGYPPGCRVVGLRQTDGMPHAPGFQDLQWSCRAIDRLDTLWSQNTSRQPKTTADGERLQLRKPQVTGTIRNQPLSRSENQRFGVRVPGAALAGWSVGVGRAPREKAWPGIVAISRSV